MDSRKPATIRDVADAARVSTATVSDILGDKASRYRDDTVAKVKEIAERLRYRRHGGSSAMRLGRFQAVGLILAQPPFCEADLIDGFVTAANELGMQATLTLAPKEPGRLPEMLLRNQIDGVVVDDCCPEAISKAILDYKIPAIWVNNQLQGPENCVWPDDFEGALLATEHLLAQGHKTISFVLNPAHKHSVSNKARYGGYAKAMEEAGLEPKLVEMEQTDEWDVRLMDEAYYQRRYGHEKLWSQIAKNPEPTAFVCYDCSIALELQSSCRRRGIDPWKAFAIVSCDENKGVAEKAAPSLTTVNIDHRRLGRVAVEMLDKRIRAGGDPVPSQTIPSSLIRRESSLVKAWAEAERPRSQKA